MGPSTASVREATQSAPPDAEALATRHAGVLKPKELRALHRWLSSLLPGAAWSDCVAALERGAHWLRSGAALTNVEPAATARLRVLVDVLEEAPAWRAAFTSVFVGALQELRLLRALELGLPNDRGLLPESTDRLARRLLPELHEEHGLGELLVRLFPTRAQATWLAELPADLALRLVRVCSPTIDDQWTVLSRGLVESAALIGARTAALGVSREILDRSSEQSPSRSPFLQLARQCDALFADLYAAAAARTQVAACRETITAVLAHLEQFGVSVDVVYRIEVIGKNLDRLTEIFAVLDASSAEARAAAALALLSRLLEARTREHSLRDLVGTNVHLLARKVIEHAGESGEHYITTTRREWWRMMASAAGGGFLTAFTAAFKFLITLGHFPLFVEGALASANYASSFVLMQLCGFTLATKQPSMIAAALAGSLHGSEKQPELGDLVRLIARICRSQLAAAIGNVGMVIPTAFAFHLVFLKLRGHPFLNVDNAEHALQSLDPTHGGTVFFAALTGVLLWLSSLGAGWLENWSTYRRLPEAIAQHRLGRIVGRRTMKWLGNKLAHNVAAFGGNVSIGVLLGMVPVIGRFFGVPLEVRHVTLSTGTLVLGVCTLGRQALGAPVLHAALGIVVILLLNFGISFACALTVALRARSIEHAGSRLLRAVLGYFLRRPFEFLLPVERPAQTVTKQA